MINSIAIPLVEQTLYLFHNYLIYNYFDNIKVVIIVFERAIGYLIFFLFGALCSFLSSPFDELTAESNTAIAALLALSAMSM